MLVNQRLIRYFTACVGGFELQILKSNKTINYKECQMPAGNNENEFDHEYIYKPLSLSRVFKLMLASDWPTETSSK